MLVCPYSVPKRVFTTYTIARRSFAVPDARAILAEHRVQPGGRVRFPARSAVARSTAVPVVHPQGAVPAHHHEPVARLGRSRRRRRPDIVVRTAQPVLRIVEPCAHVAHFGRHLADPDPTTNFDGRHRTRQITRPDDVVPIVGSRRRRFLLITQ